MPLKILGTISSCPCRGFVSPRWNGALRPPRESVVALQRNDRATFPKVRALENVADALPTLKDRSPRQQATLDCSARAEQADLVAPHFRAMCGQPRAHRAGGRQRRDCCAS